MIHPVHHEIHHKVIDQMVSSVNGLDDCGFILPHGKRGGINIEFSHISLCIKF